MNIFYKMVLKIIIIYLFFDIFLEFNKVIFDIINYCYN